MATLSPKMGLSVDTFGFLPDCFVWESTDEGGGFPPIIMLSETNKPILLLVEDSEDDAFFFTHTLKKTEAGCAVHRVNDGAKAIEFLREAFGSKSDSLPRLIFLDLKMPVLNGFEVLSWMQQQTFSTPIPVIVLSGSDLPADKERAYSLGAIDYLVKPVRAADFKRHLGDLCPEPCPPANNQNRAQV